MIVAINATAKEIADSGADFQWPKVTCEKCSRVMWSHGFVSRYFEGLIESIRMKRCRCPGCGTIVVFRPEAFWPFLRSSIVSIYQQLLHRISYGNWPKGFSRQRGGYWMGKLAVALKMNNSLDPVKFLKDRFEKKISFFV